MDSIVFSTEIKFKRGRERERERERERQEKGENLTLPTLSALMQPALGSWAYTENTHSL